MIVTYINRGEFEDELTDAEWIALEDARWHVYWKGYTTEGESYKCSSYAEACENRKTTVAKKASKKFKTIVEAILEFERITVRDTAIEYNTNIVPPPHAFEWMGSTCTGYGCLKFLYEYVPESFRRAVQELNRLGYRGEQTKPKKELNDFI